MANVVKFDYGTGGSDRLYKDTLGPSTAYTITFDVYVPTATLTAITGDVFSANLVDITNNGADDYLFLQLVSGTWRYGSGASGPSGTFTPDAWVAIEADLTHTSGNNWDIVWKAGGSTLFTDSGYNLGGNQTHTIIADFFRNGEGETNEIYYLRDVVIKDATTATIFSDDFSSGNFSLWTFHADATIIGDPFSPASTAAGVSVAFGFDALDPAPTWTRIDDPAGIDVVTGWKIKRGRSYMLDRTETGSAQADFIDLNGTMDPTNSSGPFYPMNPNCPFAIALQNPTDSTWTTLFTGMVQQVPQTLDGRANVSQGSVMADDLFSLLAIGEIPPGLDFDSSSAGTSTSNTNGDTTYASQTVQERIEAVLADAGVPSGLTNIFSGNVQVQASVEPPGTTFLEMIWNAADAEFPGVANCFVRKDGVVAFRGRLARFNPTDPQYNISTWDVGDVPAVGADPTLALVSKITFDRDVAKIVNAARFAADGIADANIPGQLSTDSGSITTYGNRTYSGDNLINDGDLAGPNVGDPDASTKEFSDYWVNNFHDAQTRISQLEFRWVPTTAANATAHWAFLCGVEISDVVNVTTTHPGGGGFSAEPYFVEGITYEAQPSGHSFPDITMTLDLSPSAYFSSDPF